MHHKQLLTTLYAVYRRRLMGPIAYPLHDHRDFGEIFWCDGGSLVHLINGEEVVMQKGDMVLIRPWDQHSLLGDHQPFYIGVVCFAWHVYDYLKLRYWKGDASVYGEDLSQPRMFRLSGSQMQVLRHLFFSLKKSSRSLLHIESFLGVIIAEFCIVPPDTRIDEEALPDWLLNAVRSIRQPEHFRLGVPRFYELCGRCPEHITRLFRKATGVTPGAYIRRLRMAHAAALLSSTPRKIFDIGLECGFENASLFYTTFRKEYGITPGTYRTRFLDGLAREQPIGPLPGFGPLDGK
ncbi:MAG TPA: AraC family transcriptional regulator [Chthoniobacteraceae bacterium]|nr:AraC family transcriptional regulator [Chthoniobacteraceae bacterium]